MEFDSQYNNIMTKTIDAPAGLLPWLLLPLVAASGCAALIYEIIWFQLLQLVIGSSAISLGLLLAAYMGGLCLGSMAFSRVVSARRHPLKVYAVIEAGIGVLGIAVLFALPWIGRIYIAGAVNGIAGLVFRGVIAAVCLLPPTILMGASFPAISRFLETSPRGVSWLGLLYSGNIAGAVLGCVLAGFYLLRVHDMAFGTYAGAAINAGAALFAFVLAWSGGRTTFGANLRKQGWAVPSSVEEGEPRPLSASPTGRASGKSPRLDGAVQENQSLDQHHLGASRHSSSSPKELGIFSPSSFTETRASTPSRAEEESFASAQHFLSKTKGRGIVYLAIAISGLTALGAEVVWTRLLSLLLGATVYTFSIILAVFLLGLGAGSGIGSLAARRARDPRMALAGCQVLLSAAIAAAAYTLAYSLPYWPVDPWLSTNPLFTFDLDLTRCLRTILPATLLWGASFPLALAAAAAPGEDPARLSGAVYAANTAGSIAGALVFSLWLVPAIGTRACQQLLIWLAAIAAIALMVSLVRVSTIKALVTIAAAIVVAAALSANLAAVPWQAIAYGRRVAPILRGTDISAEAETVFLGEGINASVVITERAGQRFFYVSGKSEASSALLDMRLQRMMGHVPALLHRGPRSVLVVGFGAGVTAGSFVTYPEVQNITICELEPIVPPASNKFFGEQNYRVLDDSRTEVVYDDARHFISIARGKFDVITTDPIHPWVKGTSTLYSKEYYDMVREHLNPGGVVAQWLPIYESDEETVNTEMATFFSVFPNATVWSTYLNGDGYDLVLIGRLDDSPIDVHQMQQRLEQPGYSKVASSLADVEFHSATELMSSYAGRAQDLSSMTADAPINRDLNMRLQYLAGLGLNAVLGPQLYRKILSHRQFPEGLLTGTSEQIATLREILDRPHRTF